MRAPRASAHNGGGVRARRARDCLGQPGRERRQLRRVRKPVLARNRRAVRLRQRAARRHAERPHLRPGRARHPAAAGEPLLELLRRALRPVRLSLAADAERDLQRRAARRQADGRGVQRGGGVEGRARSSRRRDRDPRRRHRLEPARPARPDPPEHRRASLPRARRRHLLRHVRLQRRRRSERRGLRPGPAREPLLPGPPGPGRI